MVTGAFLAERAAVVDGALHVWGGVLSVWAVHPQNRWAEFALVVLIQAQTGETAGGIRVEVISPDGGPSQVLTRDYPDEFAGGEVGFAIFPLPLHLDVDGRFVLMVSSGGGTISLPLTVETMN
ncbi:UNVERIFIED_CONTAM: hypothetical protein K7Z70_23100 [Mycobacterium avium subsp. hominissuis]